MKVVPFKASNLSLNSHVTKDGREVGMGQALQAWACGSEPEGDMNPVLLKPLGGGRMEVLLRGEVYAECGADKPVPREEIMEEVCVSFDRLSENNDVLVCEGSGSPVELNLLDRDMANVGMMRARRVPAVLVADIERGGVFAAIYGTWRLLPDDVRPLLKGYLINRFRGEASILKGGFDKIRELTGMECFGVIPYRDLKLPEEDSLSTRGDTVGREDCLDSYMRDLDDMIDSAEKAGVDFDSLDRISSARCHLQSGDVRSVGQGLVHRDGPPVGHEEVCVGIESAVLRHLHGRGSGRMLRPVPLYCQGYSHGSGMCVRI